MDLELPEMPSSSEDDLHEVINLLPIRHFRFRIDSFNFFSDTEFKVRYRFSKETVVCILRLISPHLEHNTMRSMPLSPMDKLLVCLRFYATGSFQVVIGDLIHIHKSTVCRIIRLVSYWLASQRNHFINMPQTNADIIKTKNEFYEIRNFPNVIGCVDCTHIRIQSPGGQNAELFRNRKGYFSINVQGVCNANLEFQEITARWRGSVHDSTIFHSSLLHAELEDGKYPNSFILGDNGYPCLRYLLTPLLNPETREEKIYNRSHITTRNTIERMFGVWKRRFPCLEVGLRTKLSTTLSIIVATAVLHNIARKRNDELPDDDPDVPIPLEPEDNHAEMPYNNQNNEERGFIVRNNIILTNFSQ